MDLSKEKTTTLFKNCILSKTRNQSLVIFIACSFFSGSLFAENLSAETGEAEALMSPAEGMDSIDDAFGEDFGVSTLDDKEYLPTELGPVLKEPSEFFEVIVRINKKARGAGAQTARVYFQGQEIRRYEISTGREQWEHPSGGHVYFSSTPLGWFLPTHLSEYHYSRLWRAAMWWSIFFKGGVAMHGTSPNHYRELGHRASGGCVRFRIADAQFIYKLIRSSGHGSVPVVSRSGHLIYNVEGGIRYKWDWKTLIIVEQ